jgi:hypothetical protein
LYAMDLFDYAVHCMDSFMSTPEPVAPVVDPEINPVNRANRQLGFFVAEPALPAANDPAVLYPTMNGID